MPTLILVLVSALWLVAADPQTGAPIARTLRDGVETAAQPQPRQPQQRAATGCGDVLRVPQRSFLQLPSAKYAYVWIDDIRMKLFGGFNPFALFVIVGGVYPPFQATSGKLDRASFDKLSASLYNTKRYGALQVAEDTVAGGAAVLPFQVGSRGFSLKVVAVHPSFGGGDAADIQVCSGAR